MVGGGGGGVARAPKLTSITTRITMRRGNENCTCSKLTYHTLKGA